MSHVHQEKRLKAGQKADKDSESPFQSISATMGWETFHLVQSVWLTIIDVPAKSNHEKWDLQVHSTLSGAA